ncbi:MAG TPA: hypothetical protein VJ833_02105 [Rhodanobacteraceae bacterium]|nr:hypothetical protein [Rhodanobacteraceae bacterium]
MEPDQENSDGVGLTAYERRLWVEVDRILYQNYLTPRTVTDFWAGDRDAIVASLKQMKERAIRSIVIVQYVELDNVLNHTIFRHVFGKRRSRKRSKQTATLQAMLDHLYPQQKLDIVRSFKEVPKAIASSILALNTLRNSLAHRFDLASVPKSKRLYKGKYDVFTKKGLEKFQDDMWQIDEFFQPEVTRLSLELVRRQRERNATVGPTNHASGRAGARH